MTATFDHTTSDHNAVQASLGIVSGAHAGATIDLPMGETVIGRSEGCAPLLRTDPSLSRRHAKITRNASGAVTVEDLGSLNGTRLNGSPVTSTTPIRPGDTLTLGGSTLRLQVFATGPATTFITNARGETAHGTQEPPAALAQRARILLEAGNLSGSEALFRRLLQHPGHVAAGRYGIGYIQLKRGDLSAAEESFKECLRTDPRHADAAFQRGFIAEHHGSSAAARAWYQQAISINSQHKGAQGRLRAMAGEHANATSQASLQEDHSNIAEEPAPGNVADYGVYEFLKQDNSVVSRQAIAIIDDLAIEARPTLIAYLGAYLWRALIVLLLGVGLLRAYFLIVGPVLLLVLYLYVLSVRIRLHRGRLQIERGLLRRRLKNHDIWRVRNVDLDRRLLNRMSGDGVLVFDLTPYSMGSQTRRARRGNTVRVIGLARGPRLIDVHQKLLSLEFLLRGNPVVKGIIQ